MDKIKRVLISVFASFLFFTLNFANVILCDIFILDEGFCERIKYIDFYILFHPVFLLGCLITCVSYFNIEIKNKIIRVITSCTITSLLLLLIILFSVFTEIMLLISVIVIFIIIAYCMFFYNLSND